MYENEINDLIYSYSPLEDERYLTFWTTYYENNSKAISSYYGTNKDQATIAKICLCANDTAKGFLHVLNIIKNGNPETLYPIASKPDVISGVAFIKNKKDKSTPDDNDLKPEEIVMSVGVFTTKKASFYIMVGICTGFHYCGVNKPKGQSESLAKYVASFINEPRFTDGGNQKISFITRPLQKMGELFNTGDSKELNIVYDEDLSLPPKNDASYDEMKLKVIEAGKIRQKKALDWLKSCDLCEPTDEVCQMDKCVGDIDFFQLFVLDLFSPRWGYTGKRINAILINAILSGGKGKSKNRKSKNRKSKNRRRRTLKRFTRRRLKKNNTQNLKKNYL
jgi:hypothetical protein